MKWKIAGAFIKGMVGGLAMWFAVVMVVALAGVGLATSSGCAHMSPHEKDAATTAISLGQECVAQPAANCPWTAGAEAFKDCVLARAMPCGLAKIGDLLAVGFAYAWEETGLFLSAPPVSDTPYPRRVVACTTAMDATAVAASCSRHHPSVCVANAVASCFDEAALRDPADAESLEPSGGPPPNAGE